MCIGEGALSGVSIEPLTWEGDIIVMRVVWGNQLGIYMYLRWIGTQIHRLSSDKVDKEYGCKSADAYSSFTVPANISNG